MEAVAPFGDPDRLPAAPVVVDSLIAFQHRVALSAGVRRDPGFAGTETVLRLVAAVAGRGQACRRSVGRPSHRRLALAARELLAAKPASRTSLGAVAHQLGVSPWHLSRVFAREHGVTLTAFRNTLRLQVAMDRLADGETDIARLAGDLGFADHAHLTRTMRAHVGTAPCFVRDLLRSSTALGPRG
jgi:AraC-like DNA-binding protein